MKVRVLFFGATADVVKKREIEIVCDEKSVAREAFDEILAEFPALTKHKLLFSVNQNYSSGEEIIRDGDELAIFTAVSGG
jgi:molybdopterin converting factor small subunit